MTTPTNSPTFGSFTLLAKLARGDIGDLFLARSQGAGGFEKLVIIKRIHPEFMSDEEISTIFHSEAQTAARIEHPNVRIVYEIGSNDEHHYIALEYLEGVPLVEVLLSRKRDRRLADPRLISSLISQACQGLHAAHKIEHNGKRLVHGDINPRSIFVTESGTTKLLDFDIVEMRGALAKRHGFVRRTIAYMSPEEVRSDICDRRSDIFSLGVVAWEAITGRRLFKQETRDQTLAAIDRGQIPNAKDLQGGISDALNATIMRSLSRDPSLRFQSAQDFGSALDRAMLAEGPPLTPVAISTLIKEAFGPSLENQRGFVRAARKNQDQAVPEPVTGNFDDFEKPTVVAEKPVDPDDWNTDEPATTVGGQELVEAIEAMARDGGFSEPSTVAGRPQRTDKDPFEKISEDADFSAQGEPPVWQDTRNLVLSEIEADTISESDDEEKTGAVVLPSPDTFDIENYSLSESDATEPEGLFEKETSDQTLTGDFGHDGKELPSTTRPIQPPPPLAVPLPVRQESVSEVVYPRMASSQPASIYDRRLNTIDSAPARTPIGSTLPTPEEFSAYAKSPETKRKRPISHFVIAGLAVAGVALGALLLLSSDEKPKKDDGAAAPPITQAASEAPEQAAVNSGAGAAAGILAAANGTGTPVPDPVVIPEPVDDSSPDAGTEQAEPEDTPPPEAVVVVPAPVAVPDSKPKSEPKPKTVAKKSVPAVKKSVPAVKKSVPAVKKNKATAKKAKPATKKVKTAKKPSKPAAKGPGFLTVAASPYATVFVDGKKRGITPIVKLKLPAGVHRLKLVSSAGGKSKNLKVRITSGDVVRQNVRF